MDGPYRCDELGNAPSIDQAEAVGLNVLYTGLLLKNCPDMIFLFGNELRLVACSAACRPLLRDGAPEDLINLPFHDIFSPEMEHSWIEKVYQQNSEVLKALSPCHSDGGIAFRSKKSIYAQVTVSPMMDEAGICRGTVMTVSDITELMETKRRAEEAAHSKSSFLANMSHEIRTPMNAVKGLSELLALTSLSSLQRNYVKNIISSANSLLGIINDVLDFSKIDANTIEFIECQYDLAELISGVCNVISIRADDKNLTLLIDASPDLPTVFLGDDMRIKQIITNLLSNAVKYTNEGHVCLRLRTDERDGVTWLTFEVEDSGVGIRQADIPYLFDSFSRADLQNNRSIAGTGLGLAISKQLALAMGGDIQVKSEYGKGSVFAFSIPQKVVDARPIAQIVNPQTRRVLLLGGGKHTQNLRRMLTALRVDHINIISQEGLETADLTGYTHCIFDERFSSRMIHLLSELMPGCLFAALKDMRHAMSISDTHDAVLYYPILITEIAGFLNKNERDAENQNQPIQNGEPLRLRDVTALVVDDHEINLVVGGEMLRSFGVNVICAESGDEAISLCEAQKFDLIFMDQMMPGKDGIATTAEIRKGQGPNRETPIIALTANVVNDMKTYYLKSGMDDFVGKPAEMSDISRVLYKWIPKEKMCAPEAQTTEPISVDTAILTPEGLIEAFDNFGLYASDVMREMNGDFDGYMSRMEEASKLLDDLTCRLRADVSHKRWADFSDNCLSLQGLLYGVGARDCAARARKLAIAGREKNIPYIDEDFLSLMGNMYMLDKKLAVIVPYSQGKAHDLPLNSAQYLHGCLEKMAHALAERNADEAMKLLDRAASLSLDMELDMALKAIKANLEKGDFAAAIEHHTMIFHAYTIRLASS